MPDWKGIVRKQLQVFGICPTEITEELAAHLEDTYETLRSEGLSTDAAFQHTRNQIEGSGRLRLAAGLLREEFMAGFFSKIALAALFAAVAAGCLYWALAIDQISPKVILILGGQLPAWWWWCLLPLCGALGAFLSQRYGGSRLQRMAASLLPSAILCVLVLTLFVVGFTMSGFVNHCQLASARLESLGIVPPGFGVIPAALSLLGAAVAEVNTKKLQGDRR